MPVRASELRAIGNGYLRMGDAAVEIHEQRDGFVGDYGGFEIGAGEVTDGFEGAPGGLDDDFSFAFEAPMGDGGSEVAGDAVEFGQNVFGKVFKI